MAFTIEATHLPRIWGYNDAKRWFETIKPIRGGDQSIRRLAKRNDETKWIKHEIRDGIDVYIAGFHHSNIIEYYPTHYVLSMRGWNSLSTMIFIRAITGNDCNGITPSKYIPSGFRADMNADVMYNGYPMRSSGEYKFDYDDKPMQEMPALHKYKVNRKRMNEVRKMAKPFYEYVDSMANLMDGKVADQTTYWPLRSRSRVNSGMMHLQDQDKWWALFEYLSLETARRDWSSSTVSYYRDVKAMKQYIEKELKYHSPQVLDVVY